MEYQLGNVHQWPANHDITDLVDTSQGVLTVDLLVGVLQETKSNSDASRDLNEWPTDAALQAY